jgi:putative ABC transport system permease protein
MLRATFRSLLAHKVRLLLSTLAVVLGVAFVSGSLIFTDTLERTFTDLFRGIAADVTVRPVVAVADRDFGGGRGAQVPIPISNTLVAQVRDVPGVAAVEGGVTRDGIYPLNSNGEVITSGGGAPGIGISWSDTPGISVARLVQGVGPRTAREVVVDSNTFDKLGVSVGEPVDLVLPNGRDSFTISGVFKFGETGGLAGASVVAFTPITAQQLLLEEGVWTQIEVAVDEGRTAEEVRDAISQAIGPGYEVVTQAETVAEQTRQLQDSLQFFNYFLLGFAAVALFVGTFLIFNTFSMLVAQRTRELALLRAIGASRRQVTRSVLIEAGIVGLVGAALGVLLGIGLGFALKALFGTFGLVLSSTLVISMNTVVVALILGVAVTVMAAWLPARRGAGVPPVAALRDASVQGDRVRGWRVAVGLLATLASGAAIATGLTMQETDSRAAFVGGGGLGLLIAVVILAPMLSISAGRTMGSLLPLLAGTTGRLAQENILRSPRRTAATASALLIGMTLVTLIATVSSSTKESVQTILDRTIGADLVVTTTSFQPFDPGIGEQLAQINGVNAIVRQVFAAAAVNGDAGNGTFIGGDLEAVFALQARSGDLASIQRGQAIVSTTRAEADGLAVGDTLEVLFANGQTAQVAIGATIDPNVALGTSLLLPLSAYEDAVGTSSDILLYLDIADGADAEGVRGQIEDIASINPLIVVWNQQQLKEENSKQFDQLLNVVYGLLALSVVIAILGVVNTLVLSVSERVREIGLLRAIGLQRSGVRRMIRWEAVFISFLGTVLGVVLGLGIGVALQRALEPAGITELVIPTGQIALFLVASVVVGILAALGPARRAARLDILEAIATE